MTTKIATFIRDREQKIYRLDPPIPSNAYDKDVPDSYEYVVVSAADLRAYGAEPETYIFGSDESGEVVHFSELDGSFQGALDHEQALRNAGYEVAR